MRIIHTYTFFFKPHDLIYIEFGKNDPQAKGIQDHSNGTPGTLGTRGTGPNVPSQVDAVVHDSSQGGHIWPQKDTLYQGEWGGGNKGNNAFSYPS